ncbi:PRC-barrel domain-containing protein [Pseudobacteroides cellulosolvens]|uniref:PRC-barrel domain protein n=1 Tax=Pseudobacteroides cellulosolvens ATCC 35603 = DSM 2933 TaxID=398512 RepID=A0A0L6JR35_9FIRM|nr:PRC-barrel domain-containing protein [Pseudobacteroides cellulosolvens]KNY28233.1 PRC-barrel domain protein [Pseudobacteroides cellulosolvens ATCC 35603 = DSM 2933]
MERYSEVMGLPVICVDDGKKIGTVCDLVFFPKYKKVRAVLLERTGCHISKKAIPLEEVLSMGKDAVIVNDCSCTKKISELEKNENLGKKGNLMGLRIYSKSGEDFGTVKDILFDYKTGTIEGLELSDCLVYDIMQGRNIIPLFGKVEFSEENILVDKEAIDEMQNTGGGLIKKLLPCEKEEKR